MLTERSRGQKRKGEKCSTHRKGREGREKKEGDVDVEVKQGSSRKGRVCTLRNAQALKYF